MLTVLSTLVAAFALPATLVTASDLIDSQWAVAVDRCFFSQLDERLDRLIMNFPEEQQPSLEKKCLT